MSREVSRETKRPGEVATLARFRPRIDAYRQAMTGRSLLVADMYAAGMTKTAIGLALGMSRTTVYRLLGVPYPYDHGTQRRHDPKVSRETEPKVSRET